MAKYYPVINEERFTEMSRAVFGTVYSPSKVLVKKFTQNTTSSTSPNYPLLQENGFSSQKTRDTWRPDYVYSYSPPHSRKWADTIRNIDQAACPTRYASAGLTSRVDYKALLRMYDEIPIATSNLALLYAERKSTMEGLAQALGGIVKCMREVRKGKVPEMFMNISELKNRKKFTGAWLNYTYGIAPFAADIYGIANTDPIAQIVYCKGKANESEEFSSDTYMAGGKYSRTYKFGLSLKDPLVASLAQTGMLNPALIAWELTPFSFMADWLLPVGPYLEMLTATSGYNKHNGSITTFWEYEGNAWSNNSSATHYTYLRQIKRQTQIFPSPPLPRFKNPVSPVHALNALSIIHQFTKGSQR